MARQVGLDEQDELNTAHRKTMLSGDGVCTLSS